MDILKLKGQGNLNPGHSIHWPSSRERGVYIRKYLLECVSWRIVQNCSLTHTTQSKGIIYKDTEDEITWRFALVIEFPRHDM